MFSNNTSLELKKPICVHPHQTPPTAVCGTQTMTMRQSESRRDDPTPPRYAISGFNIEMGGFQYAAAIDARPFPF